MDELIGQVCTRFGLDEAVCRKAMGQVLQFIKKNVPKDFDWLTLLSKLQGAAKLLKDANDPLPRGTKDPKQDSPVTGGLAGIISMLLSMDFVVDLLKKILTSVFGEASAKLIDSAGDGADLIGKLNSLGISTEQATKMVQMLLGFMKNKTNPETVNELLKKVPALAAMSGDEKKEE